MDDPSAAARAAGIDTTRGLTNIDAIIAAIRGEGARALSETQSPSGAENPTRQPVAPRSTSAPTPPADHATGGQSTGGGGGAARTGVLPANPFWAKDSDSRLRELEAETAASFPEGKPAWQPHRVERVIRLVGGQFPTVAQDQEWIEQGSCLTWNVRGTVVRMGFEAPENFAYWSRVLDRTVEQGQPGKVVLFSHADAPFSFDALAAMGADASTAMRYLDILKMGDADLISLYAADTFFEEADRQGQSASALRAVARHLDGLWRRIARPLSSAGAKG